MLELIKDDQGNIHAVCEYYVVDKDGHMKDDGEYIWISEVEVAPQYRNNGCLRKFVKIICEKYPNAKAGYFHRLKKYPNRRPRIYTRKQWESLTGGNDGDYKLDSN